MKKIFLPALLSLVTAAVFSQKTPAKPLESVPLDKADVSAIRERKTIATTYNFSDVRICVDKIGNAALTPKPVYAPKTFPTINANGEIIAVSKIAQGLTGETDAMWSPGDIINVGFATNETSAFVINKVKQYIKAWEAIANVKFQFVDLSQATVRVGFAKDNTSWSWLGRTVLQNTFHDKTVNFGWFDDNTAESEFSRVVLHEFGHVLGFIHEHQAPSAAISWDKEKVYAFFGGAPNNWDRAKVDANVFVKYSQNSTNGSAYDPASIMHYFFPSSFTTNNMSFTSNTSFSSMDKQFSKSVYPFPPTPTNASGVLHTGDDCDEIAFSVEYDVVNSNTIEFILEPGRDANNNLITWWKKIAVPVIGNGEVALEIQDGHSVTKSVPAAIIDAAKGISFGKAKFAGVHSGINFHWNVLPALKGGCRVKLTWKRDKC